VTDGREARADFVYSWSRDILKQMNTGRARLMPAGRSNIRTFLTGFGFKKRLISDGANCPVKYTTFIMSTSILLKINFIVFKRHCNLAPPSVLNRLQPTLKTCIFGPTKKKKKKKGKSPMKITKKNNEQGDISEQG